jgi:hypothetical protein
MSDYGFNDVGYHQNAVSGPNPQGLPTTNARAGAPATPVIDQLAAEGCKLEMYYVQPLCTPTRGTIMYVCIRVDSRYYNIILLATVRTQLTLCDWLRRRWRWRRRRRCMMMMAALVCMQDRPVPIAHRAWARRDPSAAALRDAQG